MLALLLAFALIVTQAPSPSAPANAPSPPAGFAAPGESFEIDNSGSSNTLGYSVFVRRDGTARYVMAAPRAAQGQEPESGTRAVDKAAAGRVFDDLAALQPFPPGRGACMHSASFGSSTTVVWRGERSPPLDCPSDPAYAALRQDVMAVLGQLKLQTLRRPLIMGPLPRPSA